MWWRDAWETLLHVQRNQEGCAAMALRILEDCPALDGAVDVVWEQ